LATFLPAATLRCAAPSRPTVLARRFTALRRAAAIFTAARRLDAVVALVRFLAAVFAMARL
jgi:hypothetical protein